MTYTNENLKKNFTYTLDLSNLNQNYALISSLKILCVPTKKFLSFFINDVKITNLCIMNTETIIEIISTPLQANLINGQLVIRSEDMIQFDFILKTG
jgi:hypothetical protein